MATKNIKSVGNILGQTKEYWTNAAKQFVWPIDFEHKHILVPEKDLELAEDNLMISHFRSHGWHVQSTLSVEYTKPYEAPKSKGPIFTPIKKYTEEKEPEFKCNQQFKIASTGTELKITSIDKKSIVLSYLGSSKHPIVTNIENLSKSLRIGSWIRI